MFSGCYRAATKTYFEAPREAADLTKAPGFVGEVRRVSVRDVLIVNQFSA